MHAYTLMQLAKVMEKNRLPGSKRCSSATTAPTVTSTIAVSCQLVPPAEVATSTSSTTVAATGGSQWVERSFSEGFGTVMAEFCHQPAGRSRVPRHRPDARAMRRRLPAGRSSRI